MLKSIDIWDIPERTYNNGMRRSSGRLKLDEDIMDFVESDEEAVEVDWSDYDSFGGEKINSQRVVLKGAIEDLGLKGVKVLVRGNRIFVVKEDDFE